MDFPTRSLPFDEQVSFDAFSSPDLKTWTKHENILDTVAVKWAKRAMWAPAILEKEGNFYFSLVQTIFITMVKGVSGWL